MDDKKKKFLNPEAEVVAFNNEDIITLSGGTATADWDNGGYREPWQENA